MTLVVSIGVGFALAYLALLAALLVARPKGNLLGEALRLLPDLLRLLRRLAADSNVPRAARVRLVLLLGYLAIPSTSCPTSCPCSAMPTTPSSSASCSARSYGEPALPSSAAIGPAPTTDLPHSHA
jgi:hypothetical protein